MALAEDMITFVTASTSISADIGTRMHYSHVPQASTYPLIWFQRQELTEELNLDGTKGYAVTRYDVEANGLDLNATYDLADKLRARLHGTKGLVGDTTALGIFVEDQDESYFLRKIDDDRAVHAAALSVIVHHRK